MDQIDLLLKCANKIKENRFILMGSKWQNCESEAIICQTFIASANNYQDHGDAFSWAGINLGNKYGVVDNAKGMLKLINDGSLTINCYNGKLMPKNHNDIQKDKNGKFKILRLTEKSIEYVAGYINL